MTHLTTEITLAYQKRAESFNELAAAETLLTNCQRELQSVEDALLLDGEIVGKNAAERDAKMRELTTGQRHDVMIAEDNLRVAKRNFELARLETSRLRMMVDAMAATS